MLRASALAGLLWLGACFDLSAQPLEKAVDQIVRDSLKVWDVPGAAVVIVQNDKVQLLKGYGKRELGRNEPVDAETIFPLGSCSKSFLALALAILNDEGKIGWDDPVRKHLPGFHLFDSNADGLVTIRDLVSHRTGGGGNDLLWYRVPWSQEESVRRLAYLPPTGSFRSSFHYSTLQFMAAGQAAAKHYPAGWPQLIRDRVLDPLQMSKTVFTSSEALRFPNHASAHRPNREGKLEKIEWYVQAKPHDAGSVYTNATNLAKWLRFQLGDGSWSGRRLVSAANFEETHKPNTLIPMTDLTKVWNPHSVQLSYAMGWVVQDYRGVRMLIHGGIIDGFKAI
ncbi:MAG TPA: serine hydrolase domain-containing protein, partial [Gemmataceae bacterium]|nr:serine hydrolase domain-containing protein [Gemmataceae bacterium]